MAYPPPIAGNLSLVDIGNSQQILGRIHIEYTNHPCTMQSDITLPPTAKKTCQSSGFDSGCCDSLADSCYVPEGPCYCDPTCHTFGDCCVDVVTSQCPSSAKGTVTVLLSLLVNYSISSFSVYCESIQCQPNENGEYIM